MATPAPSDKSKPSKEAKLRELAGKRVPAAVDKIRLIGNLAGYKPTAQQVDKIMATLRTACKKVEDRLRGNIEEAEQDFSL